MKTGILIAGLALAASVGTASAHDKNAINTRHMGQVSTGLCNAMNPATEATMRKFPLAIKNVGTAPNPVACSMPGDQMLEGADTVFVWLRNESAPGEVTVNCILVDGDTAITGSVSYPLSITLPVSDYQPITWTASTYGLLHFRQRSNLNCTLPPGVSMTLVGWFRN